MEREAVNHHDVIVIGASAGGVDIVQQLAAGLPRDLPAAVFIAMHVPAYHKTLLPEILARSGPLSASEASDGERIRHGHIYVARAGRHLLLDHGVVRVAEGPKENGHRPSIDALFRSAARAYGPRVIAVVLSGRLDDGASGGLLDRNPNLYVVEIKSWRLGIVQEGKKAQTQPVLIRKRLDNISTWFMAAFKARTEFRCLIWVRRAGESTCFLGYEMRGCVVDQVTWTGSGETDAMQENIRLDCRTLDIRYEFYKGSFDPGK